MTLNIFSFLSLSGIYLSESDLCPASDGLSVATTGGSWDTTLYVTRTTTDCHPQV